VGTTIGVIIAGATAPPGAPAPPPEPAAEPPVAGVVPAGVGRAIGLDASWDEVALVATRVAESEWRGADPARALFEPAGRGEAVALVDDAAWWAAVAVAVAGAGRRLLAGRGAVCVPGRRACRVRWAVGVGEAAGRAAGVAA
jgi:hypothetical protein